MTPALRARLDDLQAAMHQYDKVILKAADDCQPFDDLLIDALYNVRQKTEAALDQLKSRGAHGEATRPNPDGA